jgi:hypothetical protein
MEIHPMPPGFIFVTFIFFLLMVVGCALWKWTHDRERRRILELPLIVEGPATRAQAEAADMLACPVNVDVMAKSECDN